MRIEVEGERGSAGWPVAHKTLGGSDDLENEEALCAVSLAHMGPSVRAYCRWCVLT